MTKRFGVLAGLALILAGVIFFRPSQALATTAGIDGITVSPPILQINLKLNETKHPVEFKITNTRPVSQTLHLSTADFNALEDTGGLLFVGINPTELQKKYGLAKWLELPKTSLTLAPNQTATIHATIANRPDLASGGHYGALMIALDLNGPIGAGNAIGLHSIASVLLFVNKIGGDIHNLSLDKVDASSSLFSLPSSVTLHFRNQGNTHLLPRGTVEIHAPGGRLISKGVINQNSDIILPELSRSFTVKLTQLGLPEWPGHYQLIVNYRFDGYNNFKTYQKSLFLVVPQGLVIVILAIGGLSGLVFLSKKKG